MDGRKAILVLKKKKVCRSAKYFEYLHEYAPLSQSTDEQIN
jgi:hypothetical protein